MSDVQRILLSNKFVIIRKFIKSDKILAEELRTKMKNSYEIRHFLAEKIKVTLCRVISLDEFFLSIWRVVNDNSYFLLPKGIHWNDIDSH